MIKLHPIPSRSDNYLWALVNTDNNKAFIVDPGEAQPVIDWLEQNNYQLCDVVITHHHPDHIEGLPELIAKYQPTIYAPAADQIAGTTHALHGGEHIHLDALGLTLDVLAIPGHTANHLAYYTKPYLFCGDTLFSVGCGRLLGGTIEQMFDSLQLLKQLPDDTLVCCAHEYTQSNINFAKTLTPNHQDLLAYEQQVQQLRAANKPSLPVLLKTEKTVNPFLRTDLPEVQAAIAKASGKPIDSSLTALTVLRKMKDSF